VPDVDLAELLDSLGFRGDGAQAAARGVLVRSGLTSGRKPRIDAAKAGRIRDALERALAPVCGAAICADVARRRRPGAEPVTVEASACVVCGGSENRRAAARLAAAAAGRRRPRLLVVGGSPETRRHLEELARGPADLRLVDGLARVTEDGARRDIAWADVVLVWGPTQLDHKVSNHFARADTAITVPKRGVAALLDAAADYLDRRPARSRLQR
jgi:hypothetical protein